MSRLVITGGTLLDHSGERPGSIAVVDGRIVASGGMELAATLERDGYESFR